MGVTIERMPAERDATAGVTAAAGGCCCCCCCCLHTIGGLIGSVSAKAPKPPETATPIAVVGAKTAEPSYSVAKQYWLTLLLVCAIAAPVFFFVASDRPGNPVESFWFYALLLPLLQLGASLVVLVMQLASPSNRPGKHERLRHLGSITLRGFLGALIGIGVMIIIGVAL